MNEEEKKINADGRGITDYIPEYDEEVVSECVGVSAKIGTGKDDQWGRPVMVGTFLNNNSDGFEVSTTKVGPKKVAITVATFLTDMEVYVSSE